MVLAATLQGALHASSAPAPMLAPAQIAKISISWGQMATTGMSGQTPRRMTRTRMLAVVVLLPMRARMLMLPLWLLRLR